MRSEDEIRTAIEILELTMLEGIEDEFKLVTMRTFQVALKWVINETKPTEVIH